MKIIENGNSGKNGADMATQSEFYWRILTGIVCVLNCEPRKMKHILTMAKAL